MRAVCGTHLHIKHTTVHDLYELCYVKLCYGDTDENYYILQHFSIQQYYPAHFFLEMSTTSVTQVDFYFEVGQSQEL